VAAGPFDDTANVGVAVAPFSVMEAIAVRLEADDSLQTAAVRSQIVHVVPGPGLRAVVGGFFDCWSRNAAEMRPRTVATAILTAALAEQDARQHQTLELVWTGPDGGSTPVRRTEQAILLLLDSAARRITLVSYAVYNVPHVAEALISAAGRGVRITVIVEAPDRLAGQNTYSTLKSLGDDVARCSTVYLWPSNQRKRNEEGRLGLLHVKCAVADSRMLFLSNANLTGYAFSLNMELGLLIDGGALPSQAEAQFDRLIEAGVSVRP
jgi:phosphatidylserine/phosphatidylglycerophosphate/cardiolipin synthase-like enzyme